MTTAHTERIDTGAIPADTFAHRLMLVRAHAGHLSIRDAAEACGFGRGAWTNWEKGALPVDRPYVIEVISKKLNVDPTWLDKGGPLSEPQDEQPRRRRWSTVRPGQVNDRYPRNAGQRHVDRTRPNSGRPPARAAHPRPAGHPSRTLDLMAA